ncbi:MAG: DNA polymerase III subunit gamma/tau [Oleiphilaceae bacterium]|nr:DNA polymerase III subunit gamma/tau [Oleiphilaceae bacterium]
MSYQVLARKWRPEVFSDLVGQEHVLQALIQGLQRNRLHHAYLFTGTRGVGKTTIGRILARCLNCEGGVTATPCGECGACREIASGRFVDLIEIDAASRTKVEDMRELLDNVQYSPTRGRFKIYLIDEVHMLSNSSFNALLKTLEEPPEHVKFLFATTDPQKLPVTILSRCLQFNLKQISPERIVSYLSGVLDQEGIRYQDSALWLLARAADGSMRDALSLTDQAIAFCTDSLEAGQVSAMLGTIDRADVFRLLESLLAGDGHELLAQIGRIAEFAPDFSQVLSELLSVFHRIALEQCVPGSTGQALGDEQQIQSLARRMSPEDAQLFYQTALMARQDLPVTPDARMGFEMALLRMLAFRPGTGDGGTLPGGKPVSNERPAAADNLSEQQLQEHQQEAAKPAGQEPSAIKGEPSATNEEPSATNEEPSATKEEPSATKEEPSAQNERPAAEEEKPSAIGEEPTAHREDASAPGEQSPPAQGVEPSAQGERLSAQGERLSAQGERPSDQDNQPPAPERESTQPATASEPVVPEPVSESTPVEPAPETAVGPETVPLEAYEAELTQQQDSREDPAAELHSQEPPGKPEPAPQTGAGGAAATEPEAAATAPAPSAQPADTASAAGSGEDWMTRFDSLDLPGMAGNLAANAAGHWQGQSLTLVLDDNHFRLLNERHRERITQAVKALWPGAEVRFTQGEPGEATPSAHRERQSRARHQQAVQAMHQDPVVQRILEQFDGQLIEDSIRPQ